jgi:ketosteroid isomerase-like protein
MSQPSTSDTNVTIGFLQAFADAFNAHDADKIVSMMTHDCIFQASSGPNVNGEQFNGKESVKKSFQDVFAAFPDAKWADA